MGVFYAVHKSLHTLPDLHTLHNTPHILILPRTSPLIQLMSKRFNLPYTTQDLFPKVPSTPGSLHTRAESISGSFISNGSDSSRDTFNVNTSSSLQTLKKLFKRLFKPNTLDFETAVWEVFHLIINPKKMYRSQYYYKQQSTVNNHHYARDDPSFLILLTLFLSISAVAWGIAYSPKVVDIFKLILYMVVIDFYGTGILIASLLWALTNRLFNGSFSRYNVSYIEWAFCFDIHCNSFLIIWCMLYLVQFILLPLITIKDSFLSLLLGNTLYFGSIGYYFVITFYGFNSLPFLNTVTTNKTKLAENPGSLLQLIVIAGILPVLAFAWLLTLCFRFNVAYTMINTYFN